MKTRVSKLKTTPRLGIVLVGDNPASELYVSLKQKAAEYVGISTKKIELDANASLDLVAQAISKLVEEDFTGILLQVPVGKMSYSDTTDIFSEIPVSKDIDGLNPLTQGQIWQKKIFLDRDSNSSQSLGMPTATPKACLIALIYHLWKQQIQDKFSSVSEFWSYYDSNSSRTHKILLREAFQGKKALVVNDSDIVGKPLAGMLSQLNMTVTLANKFTTDISQLAAKLVPEILVTATGVPGLWEDKHLRHIPVVLDLGAGKNSNGKTAGDILVRTENISALPESFTWGLVPGGVGPLTVITLLENLVLLAENGEIT